MQYLLIDGLGLTLCHFVGLIFVRVLAVFAFFATILHESFDEPQCHVEQVLKEQERHHIADNLIEKIQKNYVIRSLGKDVGEIFENLKKRNTQIIDMTHRTHVECIVTVVFLGGVLGTVDCDLVVEQASRHYVGPNRADKNANENH